MRAWDVLEFLPTRATHHRVFNIKCMTSLAGVHFAGGPFHPAFTQSSSRVEHVAINRDRSLSRVASLTDESADMISVCPMPVKRAKRCFRGDQRTWASSKHIMERPIWRS